MNQELRSRLVLLPNRQKGVEGMLSFHTPFAESECLIILSRAKCGNMYFDTDNASLFDYKPQHLHLVSTEPVLKGDSYIENGKVEGAWTADDTKGGESDCAKIIASTDETLGVPIISDFYRTFYARTYFNNYAQVGTASLSEVTTT